MALITSANARQLAAKAHESRRLRSMVIPDTPQLAEPKPQPDAYLSRRLSRVRSQIERLNTLLESEEDAQKIDRLVSALYRLTDLERVIANRPLPGSLRPSSPKPDKRMSTQATFDSPLLPADNQLSYSPAPQPKPYDGPENG